MPGSDASSSVDSTVALFVVTAEAYETRCEGSVQHGRVASIRIIESKKFLQKYDEFFTTRFRVFRFWK